MTVEIVIGFIILLALIGYLAYELFSLKGHVEEHCQIISDIVISLNEDVLPNVSKKRKK